MWVSVVSGMWLGSWGSWLLQDRLSSCGAAGVHGFSCSWHRGSSPDQGLNLCFLHWHAYSSPLSTVALIILLIFFIAELLRICFLVLIVFGINVLPDTH